MKNRITFAMTPDLSPAVPESTAPRGFSGVAYGGGVIGDYAVTEEGKKVLYNVIIDMSTLTTPDKFPALVDHESDKRAGYVNEWASGNDGLSVKGVLLSNKHGAGVAQDSDEGFPWQMSIGIDVGTVHRVAKGDSLLVNGKMIDGEILVLRNCKINEVSFTPVGYDNTTSATAFSKVNNPMEGADMNLEEVKAALAAEQAKTAQLSAENARLLAENAQFSKAQREFEVKGLFSKLGREYVATDAKAVEWAALPEVAFSAVKSALESIPAHKPVDKALFSHTVPTGVDPNPPVETDVLKGCVDKFVTNLGGK